MTEEQNKLAEEIERHLAPDAIYSRWRPSMDDMRLIVAALRSPARVRLSDFVNDADIGGADSPHIVVEKLQAAIDRAREPATDAVLGQFGDWVLEELRGENIGNDLDGGAAQDKAEELGILVRVPVTEPCGERCECAEYGDFPQMCLRRALKDKGASQGAEEQEHDGELWNPGIKALHDYPNLQAMMAGCVSGHHTEWPMMRAELRRLLISLAASPDEQKG